MTDNASPNRSPVNPERLAIKRIIALENDTVYTLPPYPLATEHVPPGHIWVEGDQVDRNKTYDSNYFGPVSKSLVVGKAEGVVWPLSKFGWIRWQDWRMPAERVVEGKGAVKVEIFTM